MKLGEFNVGDKVRYVLVDGPADSHSEVLYVGEQQVLLRNDRGMEFIREADADGFDYWTGDLIALGNDLVSAIQDAAWTDNGRPNLSRPTLHMVEAITNWKKATR